MKVSVLFVLAAAASALDLDKPALLKEEAKVQLGSGPGQVCKIPSDFQRAVNPKSTRLLEEHEVTLAEPKLEKIFFVNLNRSVQRRQETEEELHRVFPGVPVERWQATGKAQAGKLDFKQYAKKGKGHGVGIGTAATWFSHYFLIKHISEQEDPNAVYLVFEDDVRMKRPNLMQDVMCQIKQLPADWDIYKFGYWGFRMSFKQHQGSIWGDKPYPECSGEKINAYTCNQRKFAFNYMGNQAYALRPGGAKAILQKLESGKIEDVDGAMMPGGGKGPFSHPNTYVSQHTMVQHYQGQFLSTRGNNYGETKFDKYKTNANLKVQMPNGNVANEFQEELSPEDEDIVDRLEKEDSVLEEDMDGRETGGMQQKRLMAWKQEVVDKYAPEVEV